MTITVKTKDKKTLAVAKYFIYKFQQDRPATGLTNKKLQKLLYYGQAWNLVLNGDKKLFKDKIEAWIHGPVVPWIYGQYKKYGFGNIVENIQVSDFKEIDLTERKILDDVWKIYGIKYDANYLELLTHSELPWQEARGNVEADISTNKDISLSTMSHFYKEIYEKSKA